MPKQVQRRITSKIDSLRQSPRPPGVEKLTDRTNQYRVRVGDYRIIYQIEDQRLIILVLHIGDRKEVYRPQ